MKESGGRGGGLGRLPGEGDPAWQEIKHQSINRCEPGDPTAAGLRRRQRDPRGAGGRQQRGRRRKKRRVAGGRAVWRGPRAGRWRTDGENQVPRATVAAAGGWVLPVRAGSGARAPVLLLAAGPGRGRLAQPLGALVPARRRQRRGRRRWPRLLEEAQTRAQETAAAASARGSANCAEYFRLWR